MHCQYRCVADWGKKYMQRDGHSGPVDGRRFFAAGAVPQLRGPAPAMYEQFADKYQSSEKS